jgi:hypothetical protein
MQFPNNPTARIVDGQIVFLFPFLHGNGMHSVFGFTPGGEVYGVLPDGTMEPLLIGTLLELPCGQIIPLSQIVECIRHKVSLN